MLPWFKEISELSRFSISFFQYIVDLAHKLSYLKELRTHNRFFYSLFSFLSFIFLNWRTNHFLVFLTVVALVTIKNSLVDPHNVLESWDINSVDPCSWRMVTCSLEGYVSAL